jgi:glucose-6-phosphate 1-dehydrogenase
MSNDKDPTRLQGIDVRAHRAFRAFYETAGCLRDVIQNHLFQIVALLAMEPPAGRDFGAVHNEKPRSSRPCAR